MAGGDGGDAHVDRAPGDPQADAPVLRQALLGDVEARHHLDARDHQRRHRALGLQHLAQHAVDAEADHQAVLERLDVDVGGVFLDRLGEHGVDQPDDRRVVLAFEQVGRLGQVLGEVREVGGVFESLDRLHRVRAGLVGLAQQRVELRLRHALELQRAAQEAAHLRERQRRGASRDRCTRRPRPRRDCTSTPWRFANANDRRASGSRRRPRACRRGCELVHGFPAGRWWSRMRLARVRAGRVVGRRWPGRRRVGRGRRRRHLGPGAEGAGGGCAGAAAPGCGGGGSSVQRAALTPGSSGSTLPCRRLELLVAHVVVLRVRLERRLRRSRRIFGRMKTIRLFLVGCALRVLNSAPMSGMLPRIRHALLALDAVVLDQAAEHEMPPSSISTLVVMVRLLVTRSTALSRLRRDARALLRDLEHHRRAFRGDLRRDLQDGADFLALDGLERVHRPAGGRRCW